MIINLINNTTSFYVSTIYGNKIPEKIEDIFVSPQNKKIKFNDFPKLSIEEIPHHTFSSELYRGEYPCIKCKYWKECSHNIFPHDVCFEQNEEL